MNRNQNQVKPNTAPYLKWKRETNNIYYYEFHVHSYFNRFLKQNADTHTTYKKLHEFVIDKIIIKTAQLLEERHSQKTKWVIDSGMHAR